jgi:diadenylate cyclase
MFNLPFQLILDAIDVLIVTYLFYRLFILVRGTRGANMFIGLILLVFLSVVAQWLHLSALSWIVQNLRTVWVIAFVIIFQPELRRALLALGQNPVLGRFFRVEQSGVVNEVVKACVRLSEEKIGGLIVMERDMGLRTIEETGTRLDARVTQELLVTIFTPPSPLHDGAVMIQGDSIVAAGCLLPLSHDQRLSFALGTRHRAALGLSEESDAILIVVSEETGIISVAEAGKLTRRLDANDLRDYLLTALGKIREEKEPVTVTEKKPVENAP